MDSLTQIALGAAVGEVVGGSRVKNRAMLWGGLAGLIPDLDVLLRFVYKQSDYLLAHRGISHSATFAILFSPLLAWIAFKRTAPGQMSYKRWWLLIFLAVFTHPLLDIMTTYGTGFLEPFSPARLALGNISIVDPLYSLPLMISLGVIAAARKKIRAMRWIWGAVAFSHLYLLLTFGNLLTMQRHFAGELERQGIRYEKMMVTPTLLNNLLWSGVAVDGEHAWIGQYSHLDSDGNITFHRQDRNLHLAGAFPRDDYAKLQRFSKGFYLLQQEGAGVIFNDLRFGYIEPGRYIFNFDFSQPEESAFGKTTKGIDIGKFFDRVAGQR